MAVKMEVTIRGLNKSISRLQKRLSKNPEYLSIAINKSLISIQKEVKENLDYRILNRITSFLIRSWQIVKANRSKLSGRMGSNIKYSAIHEFGGMAGRGRKVRIPARHYFSKAIKKAMPQVKKIFEKYTEKLNRI